MHLSGFNCQSHNTLSVQDRRGQGYCYNCVIETYQTRAYNLAYRLLSDRALAEDAIQEALLSGYRAFGGFRGDNLQSWLLRIVANTCRDMLRARKVRPSISLDAQSMDPEHPTPIELPSSAESPEEYTLRRELGNTLQRGPLSLPEEQRLAVVLVDVQGFSYEEAAEIMNCSIGTIRSRLSRGRARVRDFLQMHQELLPHQFRLEKQEYVDS